MHYSVVPYSPLLPHLHALVGSDELTTLWADESAWSSLLINYEMPCVERLWTNLPAAVGRPSLRVSLHRIHPIGSEDRPLWHSHPWPSAVKVLDGTYEHADGFKDRTGIHTVIRSMMSAGTSYEMTDPLAWHYVRPIDKPVYTIMITGKPWRDHTAPKPASQRQLTPKQIEELRQTFGDLLVWNKPAISDAEYNNWRMHGYAARGGSETECPPTATREQRAAWQDGFDAAATEETDQ